jgi:hypothetical protein
MKTFKELIAEGTWSTPDTPQKKKELKKLLSKPLQASKAAKALYNLVGDDALFDTISQIEKEDGKKADVRLAVQAYLQQKSIKI